MSDVYAEEDIFKFDLDAISSYENLGDVSELFSFDKNQDSFYKESEDTLEILPFNTAVASFHSNTSGSLLFEGVVSDSKSVPVSGLTINLLGPGTYTQVITNHQGHYSTNIDPGYWGVFIQSNTKNLSHFPDIFSLKSSTSMHITTDTIQNLTLPNVSLEVTVLDFDGNPVSDAYIIGFGDEHDSSAVAQDVNFNYNFYERDQTNNDGKTTLDLFPSSEVAFVIKPPENSNLNSFAVRMPVEKDSQVTFQFPTPVKLEGTIRDADGSELSDFFLYIYNNLHGYHDQTDSLGQYSMEINPGRYSLKFFDNSKNAYPHLPEQFELSSSDEIDILKNTNLDLTLPNISLKATVLDFEGNPVSGSSLTAVGHENNSIEVSPNNEFDYNFKDGSQTDESGKATLHLFSSSGIRLTILPPAGTNLKPLQISGLSLTENEERTFILESSSNEENPNTFSIVIPVETSTPGCDTFSACFIPFDLQVYPGSTVVWSNYDSAAHTVTAGSASEGPSGVFDSSLFMAGTTFSHTFDNLGEFEYFCMVHPWMEGIVTVVEKSLKNSSGGNEWDTRPTFGESHETNNELLVENGFTFNNDQFTLTDNHHTDFEEQSIILGTTNSFSAKVYADKKLKVQEFLFGIPNVGESHLAELGVEVWYDTDGNIDDVKVIQNSDVIDTTSLVVSHEKSRCLSSDVLPRCDTTKVSMTFLEPLQDNVMAIKAIDFKNRDQRTYLNDGFDVSGDSLNPMDTNMIPSNVRNEGLIKVTQVAKYSPYWMTDDGRTFEMNSFGSFKQINQKFERFQDSGEAKNRLHSGFGGIILNEQHRAIEIFDATKLISELPDSFGHHIEITERMTEEMKNEMFLEEQAAKVILDSMDRQNRDY